MVKDEKTGEITEIHCTYDSETRNGPPSDGRKVEGVIHWVSARHAVSAEVRLYDRLFQIPDLSAVDDDYKNYLNAGSLETLTRCYVEKSLAHAQPGDRYQFERLGYFCVDLKDALSGKPVFNRTVQLRDSWGKVVGQEKG